MGQDTADISECPHCRQSHKDILIRLQGDTWIFNCPETHLDAPITEEEKQAAGV